MLSEHDERIAEEANRTLVRSPEQFHDYRRRLDDPSLFMHALSWPALKACERHGVEEARRAINERQSVKQELQKILRTEVKPGEDRLSYYRRFSTNARGFYALYGQNSDHSPCHMGNALVQQLLIPYNNQMGIRRLVWTGKEMKHYLSKYREADPDLSLADFALSEPLDKEPVEHLDYLEIREQPALQQITSLFCGQPSTLTTFIVTNCDLRSLPGDGALARCTFIDLSGNPHLKEAAINEGLRQSSKTLETLLLNDSGLTVVPSVVSSGQLHALKRMEFNGKPQKLLGNRSHQ